MDSARKEKSTGTGRRWSAFGQAKESGSGEYFKMPLHYPRYEKADYETMPEGQLDRLLAQYGLPVSGNLEQKRKYAMEAFLWPDKTRKSPA